MNMSSANTVQYYFLLIAFLFNDFICLAPCKKMYYYSKTTNNTSRTVEVGLILVHLQIPKELQIFTCTEGIQPHNMYVQHVQTTSFRAVIVTEMK